MDAAVLKVGYANVQMGYGRLGACIHVTAIIVYLACLRYESRNFNPAKKLTYLFKDGQPVLNSDSDDE